MRQNWTTIGTSSWSRRTNDWTVNMQSICYDPQTFWADAPTCTSVLAPLHTRSDPNIMHLYTALPAEMLRRLLLPCAAKCKYYVINTMYVRIIWKNRAEQENGFIRSWDIDIRTCWAKHQRTCFTKWRSDVNGMFYHAQDVCNHSLFLTSIEFLSTQKNITNA